MAIDDDDRLLIQLEERSKFLIGAIDRTISQQTEAQQDINTISGRLDILNNRINGMWENNHAGLRLIVREEIRAYLENRSMTARDWANFGVSVVSLIVAALAYLATRSG